MTFWHIFLIFQRKQDLTFHANCLHCNVKSSFLENKKNITNLSSAELAQRVVKVKLCSLVLFVFVLRFYSPVNLLESCWAHFFLGKLSPLSVKPVLVHILLPATDNWPSWIRGKERMTVENISRSISTKKCCRTLSDMHQTEPPRPTLFLSYGLCWVSPYLLFQ